MSTAMEQAFAKLGMNRPRLVAPTHPREIARIPIKDRLIEDRAAFAAMSDDDLAFEDAALAENLESVRLEMRLVRDGEVERERDWLTRAERATAILRGRRTLCQLELTRRKKEAEAHNRAEHERKQLLAAEERTLAHQRKLETIAAANRTEDARLKAFVKRAMATLPPETCAAIWAAVNAEVVG